MENSIKFIYLDLGGVLFNWRIALNKLAKHINRPFEDIHFLFNKYDPDACKGITTSQQLWQIYKKELKLKIDIEDFLEWWIDNFEPILEMHELVKTLATKYPLGLITNIYSNAFIKMIKKGHVPDLNYQIILESCKEKMVKPEVKFFLIAQERAKILPHEILFIDDSEKNINAAKELGWNTVLFLENNPTKSIKQIKKLLNLSSINS